jgi:single-stranded DNA-binding protein
VTGRLYTRNYEQEGVRRSVVQMDAYAVAADLSHCTAAITRNRAGQAATGDGGAAPGTTEPELAPADEPMAVEDDVTVASVAGSGAATSALPDEESLVSVVPADRL